MDGRVGLRDRVKRAPHETAQMGGCVIDSIQTLARYLTTTLAFLLTVIIP